MAMQEPGRTKGFLCKHCGVVCSSMPSLLEHMDSHLQAEEDRKFKCDECGRGYRHAGSLANHKKTHEVGSFQCPICTRKLSNALALKSHLRIHTSRKKYSCFECGKAFRLASQLATHQRVHRTQESRGRTTRKGNPEHQVAAAGDDELQYVDEQGFDAAPDLHSEIGLDIPLEDSLSNSVMPELIPSSTPESDMAVSDDTGDRPFKCDMCEKSYRHHGSLINHKRTHQMGRFECPICFKQFNNLAALTSHQRLHSKTRGRPSAAAASGAAHADHKPEQAEHVPQNGEANVHFCHLCQVAFPNDDQFQDHILLHNSSSVSFELPDSMPEDNSFSYSHSVTHSPESNPYPPSSDTPPMPLLLDKEEDYDQTEGPTGNGQIYIPHPIDDDTSLLDTQGEPKALAPTNLSPGSQLSKQANNEVKQEEASAGDSDRRFKCNVCGKSYRHAGSLINHKRSHQTGIFQCSICRKSYPHLAALRSHLRIHRLRPSTLTHSTEGDWLSTEPLTHETQQGCFAGQEGDGMLALPQDLDNSVHFDSEDENSDELEASEFHREQFDNVTFAADGPEHLPHGEALMERHMCADCGKTFSDIAGIKSHMCPLRQALTNGSTDAHLDFQDSKGQHLLGDSGEHLGLDQHNGSAVEGYFDQHDFHENMHGQMMSDDEDGGQGGEEEDDGELYQCSVCGNHYTSMRALRSHLRGHTQTHGTPSSSGPSSLSSLEVEKEDELSESQQDDGSLMICSTCGESFTKKQDLLAHQLLHSKARGEEPKMHYGTDSPNGLKPKAEMESIICGKCGIACTSFQHLENHNCTGQRGDEHEDKPDIGSSFEGQEFGLFVECPGSGERQYKCDQCGRTYRHAGSLLNHKKSHKTGVFRCFVCQKRFYNLLALKNHQRTHFDVKKHTCTECGKAFKIHKQLLNHLRVHQENQAKIQELNKQIQALMQMNGNSPEGGMHPLNKKKTTQRRKRKETPSVEKKPSPGKDTQAVGDSNDPRPYVCDQCGRSYRHAGSLVNHKNSHKTGEYYCAVCNNTYSNQLAMKNHLRIHFAIKKHGCQECGKAFRGKKQLLNHTCRKSAPATAKGRGRRRGKKCKSCGLSFPSADQLAAHSCGAKPDSLNVDNGGPTGVPSQKEERPFKCNVCGRSYRHAGSLLNHKNTHKTGHFSCSFCAKPFSNPMALRNHTRIHTQKKKYACHTCGKAFRLSSILHNHQKIHARGVTHFSCQACGKSFQGKSGLKRHRCFRNDSKKAAANHAERGDKCYMCDQCGRSYRHAGSLLNHKKTHSADLLHCTLCLKTFSDPLALQSHSQMARHCCPDCGKTFCEFAHLQNHMEVHSKGQPFYCSPCQQGFPNALRYQQHQELHRGAGAQAAAVQLEEDLDWGSGLDQRTGLHGAPKPTAPVFGRAHGGSFTEPQDPPEGVGEVFGRGEEKSHVCEHCGRAYRHAGSLLNHKNSHKTGSFFCSVCHKEFTNLMALKNHRRIHTEPKRYQCLECGKAFRVSTQLICHRRIHTKEKPFSCLLCDKCFSSKSNLRHHQKMHQSTQQSYEASFSMDSGAFMGLGVDPFL